MVDLCARCSWYQNVTTFPLVFQIVHCGGSRLPDCLRLRYGLRLSGNWRANLHR
jgi:hypothetical protein